MVYELEFRKMDAIELSMNLYPLAAGS